MKITPLHGQHIEAGARMGGFAGWDMPIQYAGILEEHRQTRAKASVFDVCHMGEFKLEGATALRDLERLLTCRVESMETGQVRYGFLLDENGGTLDDLTCYRLAADRFMLVVNAGTTAKDSAWIQEHLSAGTRFTDISADTAKLDVQGPAARTALEAALGRPLPELGYFRFAETEAEGSPCILSRTGYTGERGYETYLPATAAGRLWGKLAGHGLCKPAGLGARDTLRLEMGYPLYGHELAETHTPAGFSRGAFLCMDKVFIGKEAVLADLASPGRLLVGLRFGSRRAARPHDKVFFEGAEAGEVTSGSLAPSLGAAIALAYVEPELAGAGTAVQVEIRGARHPASVVDPPFYRKGTAREQCAPRGAPPEGRRIP